jgi:F0F1-type ATP synthase assembly protein I
MVRAILHELDDVSARTMPKDSQDQNWGRYLGIGLEIAVGGLLGYLVGAWLDRRFGWNGKGVLIGVCIGLAAGMYLMIKQAIKINKD